jgi:hypothetical protein
MFSQETIAKNVKESLETVWLVVSDALCLMVQKLATHCLHQRDWLH